MRFEGSVNVSVSYTVSETSANIYVASLVILNVICTGRRGDL
jgi:hypothetical protein